MNNWRTLLIRIVAGIVIASPFVQSSAQEAGSTQQAAPSFTKEQIDQLVAPIALYPDSLLSQVLMAATYPADVADAAKWSKANPKQQGDNAVLAVENQPWDPSVKALVAFPQVLQMMGDKPDWVQNIGDAFLASPKDVLDSAQRLRAQAQQAGNLQSNEQQKVVVDQQVIRIEPTNPEVVYAPAYDPNVVYGTWPYPSYPPYYLPPPPAYYPGYYPGAALASGLAFGVGVGITSALWSDVNWGGGDVDVNVNKYNNVNRNNQIDRSQNKFQHNAANRRGTPYRDASSRQQYSRNVPGAAERTNYRGRDPGREAQRQQAQASLQQRGMDTSRAPGADRRADGAGRRPDGAAAGADRQRAAAGGADRAQARQVSQTHGRGDNALRDAGSGQQSRQQFDRGSASRQSMAQHGGGARAGGGGARAGGGGSARAGGGGGRGGGRR